MLAALSLPLAIVAAVLGGVLAVFAWLHRDTAGAGPLSMFLLTASLMAVSEGMSVFSPGEPVTLFWAKLGFVFGALVPLAWLLTVLEYTGRERWITLRTAPILLVEPVVFSLLVWSNEGHGLVWASTTVDPVQGYTAFSGVEALAFWGHLMYVYLLVAIGAAILLRLLWRSEGPFRDQSTALLAAIAIPMIVSGLYSFDLLPLAFDPTGLTFVLSGVVLAGAIFRGQLLNVSPAARELGREQLVAELDDPVVIVDTQGAVVDVNEAGERLLSGERTAVLGRQLAAIQPALASSIDGDDGQSEVSLEQDEVLRHYDVRVSSFTRAYGHVSGQIISLRDVTERTHREQRLDVMNRLFRHNLRNEMNVVRGNAELIASALDDPDLRGRADRIMATVDEIIDRSDKVGALSNALDADATGEQADITQILDSVVERAASAHPEASITFESGVEGATLFVDAGPSIEIALDELLDNALEHHDGEQQTVVVSLDTEREDRARIQIRDDGPGIPDQEIQVLEDGVETPLHHGSGIGLWLVTWIIERAGGTIEFDVTDAGTTVTVTLPTERNQALAS